MDYYSVISKSYNKLYGEEQIDKLKFIKKHAKILGPLLDVGCGTGLSLSFFKVKSIGIDPSHGMIKIAKGNVIKARAESLPFKDKSFNTVISVTSIQNFKNPEKAIKEMIRVSKNNNIIITIMKKSAKVDNIRRLIKKHLKNFKEYGHEKDIVFTANY